jgi:hypothetical protein
MDRRISIMTGVGGMDLFDEALELHIGVRRVYMHKVSRILRKIKGIKIRKSRTGRLYRRIGAVRAKMNFDYRFESYRIAP